MSDKTPINYEDVIKAIDNFEKLDQEIVNKKPDVIIPYYTLDHLATELSQAKAELEKKDNRIKDLEQKLNAKEILSTSMPPDTEFVIMTKANYERNFGKT